MTPLEVPVVGNSDDRLIPSANLKGEILVPYRSPQQHLTKPPAAHSLKKTTKHCHRSYRRFVTTRKMPQ